MSKAKHQARRRAVQALYMWRMTGNNLADIELQFLAEQDMKHVDKKFFKELLHQVPKIIDQCESEVDKIIERAIDEVDPIEIAILGMAYYELVKRIDIPYRVVINEAVELAKVFGAEESYKFINGVVDKLARQHRAVEVQAGRRLTK